MNTTHLFFTTFLLALLAALGIQAQAQEVKQEDGLYKEIMHMDSVLFDAYNSQNIETLKNMFSNDLEFYHDKGGLANYQTNIEALKSLFVRVPDLRRQLVAGSTEIYSIKDYGAVQIGAHRFCHKEAGRDDCGVFKFVNIWKKTAEGWKLARVISYNH